MAQIRTNKAIKLAILVTHPIQYFSPLYRKIAKSPDIDLTVYYCSRQGLSSYTDKGFGKEIKWDVDLLQGYKSIFLPNLRGCDRVGGFFSLINLSIVNELRQSNFDALWVHGHAYMTHMLAIIVAKLLKIPVMMRCETHLELKRSAVKKALRRPLMTVLYKYFCSACLAIGKRNVEFYRFHGVSEEQIFLVPYTVDNEFFIKESTVTRKNRDKLRETLDISPDTTAILFASKMIPRKNAKDLLLAFHNLSAENLPVSLIYMGAGEQEAELKSYIENHALKNVHFLGFQNQSVLSRYYTAADIFVLPSVNEPWGLVINEVMCAGLPVIASSEVGAAADLVIDEVNGFMFEAGNISELTNHLIFLVKNKLRRKQMGCESLNIIKEWSYDQAGNGLKDALKYVTDACR